jgi:hypothetical protein
MTSPCRTRIRSMASSKTTSEYARRCADPAAIRLRANADLRTGRLPGNAGMDTERPGRACCGRRFSRTSNSATRISLKRS